MADVPKCYDCLSENVTVKVIDPHGFEHWYCADDGAAEQASYEALMKKLADATAKLTQAQAA